MDARSARSRYVWYTIAGCIVFGASVAALVPQFRWRIQLLALHISGKVPDITLREVVAYMMPGSDQVMTDLVDRRNPYAVIKNVRTSSSDTADGAKLFLGNCSSCHGPDGAGSQAGPALVGRELEHGDSDWAVYRTIRDGVANTAMPATPALSETQRWQVIAFVRSLGTGKSASDHVDKPAIDVNVPYATLAAKAQPDAEWLTYSGSYSGTRHSALRAIDQDNVASLALKWLHQFDSTLPLEVTPLVSNSVMFVTVPPCSVQALDAATGRRLWNWECTPANYLGGEFGTINRGVALLGDKVFFAAQDARLFAIEAATGKQVWQAIVEPDSDIYYITGAPLALRDIVVTGTSTRQVGRGSIVAFDALTGKERWRFHTVPGPGEAGHDTWGGNDSWRAGGGPAWLAGTYDPKADLIYWGIGNPKPDYDTDVRPGDNLYTNSVVALRGSTGELAWHFQFVPGDDRDWGANQIPVLVDYPQTNPVEQRMLMANRNGFLYAFDRIKGTYLFGRPFAQVNWTPGLTATGRPLPLAPDNGREGRVIYPGNIGATHWSSPTYYAARDLMIVPVLEQGMVYFPDKSSPPRASGRSFYTAIRALNARTGELVWEHRRPARQTGNFMPGIASTAGAVVFGSDGATFFALDINDGQLLWSVETGGNIVASPMTFEVNGQQFVSIAAGGDLLTFGLPPGMRALEAKLSK